ncbi:MAG TPA: hypothetical protein V6D28_27100 [Leptolyngbyaceae cyanobacterium]
MLLRYILAWIPMIAIAIFNATIRETTYGKYFSELRSHQISTITGVLFFGLYIWGITQLWGFTSMTEALLVGLIWLGLTVIFEFGFGRYVAKHSWEKLLGDYNILAGRIWIIILIWLAIAPMLFYKLLG